MSLDILIDCSNRWRRNIQHYDNYLSLVAAWNYVTEGERLVVGKGVNKGSKLKDCETELRGIKKLLEILYSCGNCDGVMDGLCGQAEGI